MLPVLLATALLGCRPTAPKRADLTPPDIVVVVLDTTRRDHLSTYGYARPTSPTLDRVASQGVVYDNAYSTSSWTAPAHASLFTGLYAAGHQTTQEHWDLASEHDTLAERLSSAGYATHGVVANPMLARSRGFAQGFQSYREAWRDPTPGRALDDAAVEHVLTELGARPKDRPYFLFVNLIGPHSPYDSCGSFCDRYTAGKQGPVSNDWSAYYLGHRSWSESDLEYLRARYDAELHEVDRNLGRLLEAIDRHGRRDNTLLVVTSDHGEHFGEHGHLDHVFSLHEPVVQIPLVIRWPNGAPTGRVPAPVQLHDLFPTVLAAAGVGHAPVHGQALQTDPRPDRPVFLEYYTPLQVFAKLEKLAPPASLDKLTGHRRRLRAMIDANRLKLHWGSDEERRLYDLAEDPAELQDLAVAQPRKRIELETKLEALHTRFSQGTSERGRGAAPVDAETQEQLEALGYMAPAD